MKRILLTLGMLLFAVSLQAATITFGWDPKPAGQNWTKVRIYEKIGTTYTMLVEVDGSQTQAVVPNVTPGSHMFVARSFDGVWESLDSNTVTTGTPPSPPSNLKVLIVVLAGIGALVVLLWLLTKRTV